MLVTLMLLFVLVPLAELSLLVYIGTLIGILTVGRKNLKCSILYWVAMASVISTQGFSERTTKS